MSFFSPIPLRLRENRDDFSKIKYSYPARDLAATALLSSSRRTTDDNDDYIFGIGMICFFNALSRQKTIPVLSAISNHVYYDLVFLQFEFLCLFLYLIAAPDFFPLSS